MMPCSDPLLRQLNRRKIAPARPFRQNLVAHLQSSFLMTLCLHSNRGCASTAPNSISNSPIASARPLLQNLVRAPQIFIPHDAMFAFQTSTAILHSECVVTPAWPPSTSKLMEGRLKGFTFGDHAHVRMFSSSKEDENSQVSHQWDCL